jgi:nucleoside-diphosphate-sugar epimerase
MIYLAGYLNWEWLTEGGRLLILIEAELGWPVKSQVGGPLLMRFLGLFNKVIAETVEMMYEWKNPYLVDTSKAEKAFGLKPTLLKQALKEMLEWCKTQRL